MDVTLAGAAVNRSATSDQLSRVTLELSADGEEVGVGTIVIDDLAGADEIAGGRQCMVEEGATLISDGFIGMQDRNRGSNPAKPHREDVYQIEDANRLFYGMRFVKRSRPAETDRARVLAFAALDLAGVTTTEVLSTNLVTLPAKVYTGSDWLELMRDVSEATGKRIFLHDLADGTGRCLHSHRDNEGHTSGLTISDVLGTATATTFYPTAPNRNRVSSSSLTNDVYGIDQAGRIATASDSGSITAHDADGLTHKSYVDFEAGSQTELNAKVATWLTENKDETDSYTCTLLRLDEDALALIRPGDRITVTSQAMALTASTIRIAHLSLTISKDEGGHPLHGYWDAALELNEAIKLRGRGTSGKKPTAVGAFTTTCQETFVRFTGPDDMGVSTLEGGAAWQNETNTIVDGNQAILTDNALPFLVLTLGTPMEFLIQQVFVPGQFLIGGLDDINCGVQFFETATPAFTGEKWAGIFFGIDHLSGPGLFVEAKTYSNIGGVTLSTHTHVYSGSPAGLVFKAKIRIESDGTCRTKVWLANAGEPAAWDASANGQGLSTIGSMQLYLNTNLVNVNTSQYKVQWFRFGEGFVCLNPLPQPGQMVENEQAGTGDGATTVFHSDDPYQAGSLRVRMNGVVQTSGVDFTESDVGEFTFTYAPLAGAEIVIEYQVAI